MTQCGVNGDADPLPDSPTWPMDCISEGTVVLIQRDKTYRPFKLRRGKKINFEKTSFYPDGALGHRYGSCFKVVKQNLELIDESREIFKGDVVSGCDNRNIHDDGTSQELTEGDVKVMKDQGISGQGIIASMVEHSNTFKEKTKYSQEKYIRKKERKYNTIFRIVKTTTKILCEMYLSQSPTKTYYLRTDTLAQILTHSNVHANSNMIVMETCQGFMVGAMLERMGGYGKLVQVFHGDYPVRTILENFGHLSPTDKSILMTYPLHRVGALLTTEESKKITEISKRLLSAQPQGETTIPKWKRKTVEDSIPHGCEQEEGNIEPPHKRTKLKEGETIVGEMEKPPVESIEKKTTSERDLTALAMASEKCMEEAISLDGKMEAEVENGKEPISCEEKDVVSSSEMTKKEEEKEKKESRRKIREETYEASQNLLTQRRMDGLVVICRHHPETIVMSLMSFVSPSRPLIVYCHILEPLIQCYKSLKESERVFNLQISETWTRLYQVLQERTHPEMMMDSQSGYILTGTTVNL